MAGQGGPGGAPPRAPAGAVRRRDRGGADLLAKPGRTEEPVSLPTCQPRPATAEKFRETCSFLASGAPVSLSPGLLTLPSHPPLSPAPQPTPPRRGLAQLIWNTCQGVWGRGSFQVPRPKQQIRAALRGAAGHGEPSSCRTKAPRPLDLGLASAGPTSLPGCPA